MYWATLLLFSVFLLFVFVLASFVRLLWEDSKAVEIDSSEIEEPE